MNAPSYMNGDTYVDSTLPAVFDCAGVHKTVRTDRLVGHLRMAKHQHDRRVNTSKMTAPREVTMYVWEDAEWDILMGRDYLHKFKVKSNWGAEPPSVRIARQKGVTPKEKSIEERTYLDTW